MEYLIFVLIFAACVIMYALWVIADDNIKEVKRLRGENADLKSKLITASVNDLRHPVTKKFISVEEFRKLKKKSPELWTNSL